MLESNNYKVSNIKLNSILNKTVITYYNIDVSLSTWYFSLLSATTSGQSFPFEDKVSQRVICEQQLAIAAGSHTVTHTLFFFSISFFLSPACPRGNPGHTVDTRGITWACKSWRYTCGSAKLLWAVPNERKRTFALRVDRITVNFLFILDTPRFKLSRALFDRSFRRPFALSVPGKLFDGPVSRSGENGKSRLRPIN